MAASLLHKVERGSHLSRAEAEALMEEILAGAMGTEEIVRLLIHMNSRPVEIAELAGFASAMRRRAAPVFSGGDQVLAKLVDTCGTGGKTFPTFNISTAAAIVASAAGARVAKHGNRGMSSQSGSADVLEALGVRIECSLTHFGRAIRELGIGFLFAPAAHSSMRHAAPARKQIGARTVFNLLGPLTNPAGAACQVVGVPSAALVELIAGTLLELGTRRALVVHGAGGLDEISLSGETLAAEIRDGRVLRFTLVPEDFALPRAPVASVAGSSPERNATKIRKILDGEAGPCRDIVVMNSAAALVISEVAGNWREGQEMASRALDSGEARTKLEDLCRFSASET
jgi:anthranilate phosphoribosyltransferase